VGDFLSVDLGDGVRATYYMRGACSIAAGMLVALITAMVATGPVRVPERTIAGVTGFAIAVSVVLIALYP
jgi:hypothetical protein